MILIAAVISHRKWNLKHTEIYHLNFDVKFFWQTNFDGIGNVREKLR